MADTPIRDLDFDQIKNSLKDYLRGQEQFQDYDFEGSTMNILLDLLAYNTHYQAFYANMVANEAFLDSALIRNSVVSLAKQLNYTPRSKKASRVNVSVELIPIEGARDAPAVITVAANKEILPIGKTFTARDANGRSINFVTLENYTFRVINNRFFVSDVFLYEGSLQTTSFIVNRKDANQKFIIEDENIDIDSLVVRVQRSVTDSQGLDEVWTRVNDTNRLNGDTTVFFVQESEGNKWEIYFGDGILGKSVENGNLISVVYLRTNGVSGNGIGSTDTPQSPAFTTENTSTSTYIVSVNRINNVVQSSFGGSDSESIDSIKYYAPKNFQAQDRAVTANDYLTALAKNYSIRSESFLVWGGEENDPPQYGKVFISVKPKNASKLSIQEKQSISRNILSPISMLTVTPEVVDPDLTYINTKVVVYYDQRKTTASPDVLSQGIRNKILQYGNENLDQFGKNFRQSKFSSYIDGLDPSINSNRTSIVIEKRLEPQFGKSLPYTIKFDNAINHPIDGYTPVLSSSPFFFTDTNGSVAAYLDDDGYGNVRIYKLVGQERIYIKRNAGTINYSTGLVELKSFAPLGIPDGNVEIKISLIPERNDIFVRRNQVLLINDNEIDITVVPESTVIDKNASDANFPYRTS